MPTSRSPRRIALARSQVHNALAKLRPLLTPGVRDLARRLLDLLDEQGTVAKTKIYSELFPLADAKSASAQTSKLLKALREAAREAQLDFADKLSGSKQQGGDSMRLGFTGPRPTLRHDAEGLTALQPGEWVEGQRGLPLLEEKRIVLLTFNENEFKAVAEAFAPGQTRHPTPVNGVPMFPLSVHGGVNVLLRHSPQGNMEAQRTVHELKVHLQPLAVVAVGIAFGMDEASQAIGDVLVSTFICNVDFGKVHADGDYTLRGARPPASRTWVDAARQVDLAHSNGPARGAWPTVVLRGLLSGEKLIDNINYRDRLVKITAQDDFVGGEMEGSGLQTALDGSGIDWIVIKAICDWADGRKEKDKSNRQRHAAQNAATVVKAIIDSGLVSYADADRAQAQAIARKSLSTTTPAVAACPPALRPRPRLRAHMSDYEALRARAAAVDGKALEVDLNTLNPDEPHTTKRGEDQRPTVVVLQDILGWATDPQARPLYALLGEYGMGKTTTCQRAAQELQARHDAGDVQVPVPLYFDLRKVERLVPASDVSPGQVPTLRETIEDCLRHGFLHEGGEVPRYEDVLAHIDEGAVIFFDGLDEVLSRLGEKQGLTFTANLLKVIPEAANRGAKEPRVLLSCRTQFFRSLAEQHNHLTGEHRGARPAAQYRAMALLPFDDDQIRSYLAAVFPGQDAQQLLDRIAEVHNLHELSQRPFTLKLVAQFLPRIERWRAQGRTVTGATLYREVAREWLIRDKEKQSFKPEVKERLAADLASHLWRNELRGLKASELEAWLGRWLAAQEATADFQRKPIELLQEDLRNSTFLKRVDASRPQDCHFEFAHTSMLEYFLADHLFRALAAEAPDRQAWALRKPSDETLDFLGQMLAEEPERLQVLAQWRRPYQKDASELLLAYAQQAYLRGWPLPMLERLDLQGAQLNDTHFGTTDEEASAPASKLNLRDADFTGAHLRRARFWHVDLRGARFEHAALTQSEFLSANLDRASWAGADTAGAVFRPLSARAEATPNASAPAALALASGHSNLLKAAAISPDGLRLLSAGNDCTLRLWDAASGECLRVFQGHQSWINACAFSHDGLRLLSASFDRTLRLWNAASGECLRVFQGHESWVNACVFSHDGLRLLSASNDRTLRLWDAASGACLRVIQGHQNWVKACAFSLDGLRLLSASDDRTLRLWDAASGACLRVFQGHEDKVNACAFSHDGRRLLSAGNDCTLRLWDAISGECLRVFQGHEDKVNACAFSNDGLRLLSAGNDCTLRLWDATSGECLRVLQGHQGWVKACALSLEGLRLFSACDHGTLRLWDAASGECLRVLPGKLGGSIACAFSQDGLHLLSSSDDRSLRLWNAASGACLRVFQGHQAWVKACAFSLDGLRLLSASDDRTLRLWDAVSGACLRVFQGHQDKVNACAFSHDGLRLISASDDRSLRLWDAAAGKCLRVVQGHEDKVNACAFSQDGLRLLSASADRTLRLWDATSGECLRVFQGHQGWVNASAFSLDGLRLLSASDDSTLRLWNAASGECLRVFKGHQGGVNACAFSLDGLRLLSASDDSTLRLWDAASGECLRVFRGHQGGGTACAFSHDGLILLSASSDATLRLWDAASGECLRVHLQVPEGSAAWEPKQNRLLHASGRAWRYLRWQGLDTATGRQTTWPLECPPDGVDVTVRPWAEALAGP